MPADPDSDAARMFRVKRGDRAAFAEILKDSSVRVVTKEKLADAAEVEELRKVRKDFDPKQLRTAGY